MKIALSYDLRSEYLALGYCEEQTAEFDRDDTIDAIESALRERGHETVRIGRLAALMRQLLDGNRWDLVFNIAEGLHGFGRESQIPALLEAYRIPCTFADSLVLALSLHKGLCKRVVRDLGINTPGFALVNDAADVGSVDLPFPLFVKPVAEGTSKGITDQSVIDTPQELCAACRTLLAAHRQPVLVERFLPGREFTVGVVGTGPEARAAGAMEVLHRRTRDRAVYSYDSKEHCEELIEYRLAHDSDADAACALALDVWRGLGCRDAGRVDVRMDEHDAPSFIEVNPLAGLHPEHSDLPIMWGLSGRNYVDLIDEIVTSAGKRIEQDER